MDILRNSIVALLLLVSVASSTPVDATRDLLDAIEYGDGDRFLELMSESVRAQIELSYRKLKELAAEDPGMAETLFNELGINITVCDIEWMTTGDFITVMLGGVHLPPAENVISEEASLNGRTAVVVFTWDSGYTLTFRLSWEESDWKVTGTSVLDQLF